MFICELKWRHFAARSLSLTFAASRTTPAAIPSFLHTASSRSAFSFFRRSMTSHTADVGIIACAVRASIAKRSTHDALEIRFSVRQ